MPEPACETMLKASALHYLFRACLSAETAEQQRSVELNLVRLINDLSNTDGGFVALGSSADGLMQIAREREIPFLERAVERACADGIIYQPAGKEPGITAAPLYVRERLEGVVAVLGPDCSELLGAVITLASSALENGRECDELRAENRRLQSQVSEIRSGILGDSPAIRHVRSLIEKVAPRDATVLILGETGTGKELIAHAVHEHSMRARGPFIAINCAALSETLLESELFGHERGSFTGAAAQKKGKLELGEGGTVFLDEIGELALPLQAKLLRTIQERTFERVGGTVTLPLDIRVIAATNRDLAAEASRGNFRSDLYHRLNVVSIRSPALRDRQGDIALLARHFVQLSAARCHRQLEGVSAEAERCLTEYQWPGNVRELQNAIEHAVILGSAGWILVDDLPETVLEAAGGNTVSGAYHKALGETRRECVARAWKEAGGDHDAAAALLGMHPNSLRRLIRQLQLREVLGVRAISTRA